MKKYLVVMLALIAAATAVTLSAFRVVTAPPTPPAARASLPAAPTSYLGAYEAGSPPSYQPVRDFAAAAGDQPNLMGYFSGWAEPFAASYARMISKHHGTPFVQIDPTYASVQDIAAGYYDAYLRSYADSVRDFGDAVVIGFGHEMNAPWYSWGYGHVSPATFVAAWRHIVSLFHNAGADNVTWLWTINADQKGTGPIAEWWPGSQYVTWVGIDGFYYRPSDTFASIFAPTINQVRVFTGKPVLLAETAITPHADRFIKIGDLFTGISKYKTLGLMWFDISQNNGINHQDWRLEGDQLAETAFRLGVTKLSLVRPQS